jgi:hypothetical protein
MHDSTTKPQRPQQDRDRLDANRQTDEPRNVVAPSHDPATPTERHAGFDDDLNPIDDEGINTHGSER